MSYCTSIKYVGKNIFEVEWEEGNWFNKKKYRASYEYWDYGWRNTKTGTPPRGLISLDLYEAHEAQKYLDAKGV